jgi:hypothetical protein
MAGLLPHWDTENKDIGCGAVDHPSCIQGTYICEAYTAGVGA